MKKILLIFVLVFIGCDSKSNKKENKSIDPCEKCYNFKQDSNFSIVDGKVYYKKEPFEGELEYTDSTDKGVFEYRQKFSKGLPLHYRYGKNSKYSRNTTYFIHRKFGDIYEVIDYGYPWTTQKEQWEWGSLGVEFDEIYKKYFHFLYRESKLKNEKIVLEFLMDIEVGDGIFMEIGKFNVEFPNGNFSLFLIPMESGSFYNLKDDLGGFDDSIKEPQIYSEINFVEYIENDSLKYDIYGEYKEFHPNNKLTILGSVNYGGKVSGEYREFNKNNNIKNSVNYVNGERNGKYVSYHENGNIEETSNYVNGKLDGKYVVKHKNDSIYVSVNYVNGERNGKYIQNYEDGSIEETSNYVNGKLDGKYVSYHENGNIEETSNYVNGKLDGKYVVKHKNDSIYVSVNYVNGERNGKYIQNYEDGSIAITGKYVNGKKDGTWMTYSENQNTSWEERFNMGIKIMNCQNRDRSSIRSEMSEMDRRVINIVHGGNRIYYVQYLYTKINGKEEIGEENIDYSNKPKSNCELW